MPHSLAREIGMNGDARQPTPLGVVTDLMVIVPRCRLGAFTPFGAPGYSAMTDVALKPPPLPQPIPDLEPLSWVLRDLANPEALLRGLDEKSKNLALEIVHCARRLRETTDWDGEALIQWLGCPTETVGDFRKQGEERFAISQRYLVYLETLSALIEVPYDKRMLVVGYGQLYARADRDLRALKRAFDEESEEITPKGYLQLGEVQFALDAALATIEPGSAKAISTPFDGLPPVHISTSRLDALARGDREFSWPNSDVVALRMQKHFKMCEGCRQAFESRVELLDRSTTFRTSS